MIIDKNEKGVQLHPMHPPKSAPVFIGVGNN